MTTWGRDLWDQWQPIRDHTKEGLGISAKISEFLRQRALIEAEYVLAIHKLVKDSNLVDERNLQDSFEFHEQVTLKKSYSRILKETADLSKQHAEISEKLAESSAKIKKQVKQWTLSRKTLQTRGDILLEELVNAAKELENSKKALMKAQKDLKDSRSTVEKLESDPESTKSEELEKMHDSLAKKIQKVGEMERLHKKKIQATSEKQRQHYERDMFEAINALQELEEQRVERMKEVFQEYHQIHTSTRPFVEACLVNLQSAAEAIDAQKDSEIFTKEQRTGYPIPTESFVLEDLQKPLDCDDGASIRSTTLKKRKSLFGRKMKEERDDFSHLPPEQQKRRLLALLSKTENEILHLQKTKEGIEALTSVYQAQPSFASKKAREKSFRQMEDTLAQIQQTQDLWLKYKGYLEQLGAPAPEERREKNLGGAGEVPSAQTSGSSFGDWGGSSLASTPEMSSEVVVFQLEEKATALFSYTALTPEELSFSEGDSLTILQKDLDGWWRARFREVEGLVPHNYFSLEE